MTNVTFRRPPAPPAETPIPKAIAYHGKPATPYMRKSRQRFRFWYDAIIDWMLVNPDKPLKQCAKDLGRGEDTIYTITSSDIFRARLAERRQDFNDRLAMSLGDAAGGVAVAAMMELKKRIVDNPAKIPTVVLNDIANKTMERLGYGTAPVAPAVQVNNITNTVSVSSDALKEAKAAMREVHRTNAETVIVEEPVKISRREQQNLEDLL